MRMKLLILLLVTALIWLSVPAQVSQAQNGYPLDLCRRAGFSTEEDFMMREGEAYDGNPYVSDGDVLSPSGQVCARNRDLLAAFDVREDLGLDALDILSVEERLIAFSTELDSPRDVFSEAAKTRSGALSRWRVAPRPTTGSTGDCKRF